MKFYRFNPFGEYTIANEIIEFAKQKEVDVPPEGDGRVHPGKVCGVIMRKVLASQPLRMKWGIEPWSLCKLVVDECQANRYLVNQLIMEKSIDQATVTQKELLLYSKNCAEAILSILLEKYDFTLLNTDCEVVYIGEENLISPKTIENKRDRVKTSLF